MNEPQVATGFDEAERGRIRAALRRYMAENRIGTPTLQYRIIEADKPRHREIPLATLQRFLRDKHHTQDHHVALCHAFVKELPYYGEGRDLAQFGTALTSFFLLRWPEREGVPGPDRFYGSYRGYTDPKNESGGGLRAFDEETRFSAAYSTLRFLPEGETPYVLAEERIAFVPPQGDAAEEDTQPAYSYDGILVAFGPLMRLMLRNNLTRQPRFYDLTEIALGVLKGRVREPSFMADTPGVELDIGTECLLTPERRPNP